MREEVIWSGLADILIVKKECERAVQHLVKAFNLSVPHLAW